MGGGSQNPNRGGGVAVDLEKKTDSHITLPFRSRLDVEEFEAVLDGISRQCKTQGLGERIGRGCIKPRAFYCVPVHSNPTGLSVTEDQAARMVNTAERHECYVFADEPYPLLNFVGGGGASAPDAPLKTSLRKFAGKDAPEIISMGTFSKILAPGLR